MKPVVSGQWSVVGFSRLTKACILLAAILLVSCSVPNLEEQDCREARDVIREFYSLHFGKDRQLSAESGRLREKYLTRRLKGDLNDASGALPEGTDYFTATTDFPKAFRVGDCQSAQPGEPVLFNVLLFWKDDERTEQKHILVTVKKEDDAWRIDSVSPLDK
jgi:hypothetical protein